MWASREPWPKQTLWWALAAFVVVEALLCCCMSCSYDLLVYKRYSGPLTPEEMRLRYQVWDIEYPPVSVAFLTIVDYFESVLVVPDWFRQTFPVFQSNHVEPTYMLSFHLLIGVTVVLSFLVLWWTIEREFAHETRLERLERVLTYVLGLVLQGFVLHDRFDFPLGFLSLLFVVCMLQRRHWFWSGLFLALAIGYKIVPVVFVPLWLLGTIDSRRSRGEIAGDVLVRLVVLFLLVIAPLLAFYYAVGPRSLVFLQFHSGRGIEVESTYAAIMGVCKQFGADVGADHQFGCWELIGPLSKPLVRCAPIVIGVPLLLAQGHLIWKWRSMDGATQRRLLVAHTIFAALVVLFGNKVLSPQYLCWIVPLVPLVPLEAEQRRNFFFRTLVLYVLIMLGFPMYFAELISDNGPTSWGTLLLVARTVVFLALIMQLGVAMFRGVPRPASPLHTTQNKGERALPVDPIPA